MLNGYNKASNWSQYRQQFIKTAVNKLKSIPISNNIIVHIQLHFF